MSFTVEGLKQKIIEKKQELSDLETVLRVYIKEGMSNSENDSPPSETPKDLPTLSETGKINLAELSISKSVKKRSSTLQDEIVKVIERFDDQEFTNSHVVAALKGLGKASEAKNFNNRASMIVRKLAEEGIIIRTHKGKGNEPHLYKLKSKTVSFLKPATNEKA